MRKGWGVVPAFEVIGTRPSPWNARSQTSSEHFSGDDNSFIG